MIITVAGFKGGVAKTTTAIHLAAYLAKRAPTLLVDGDANRSALAYSRHGLLPFRVVDEKQSVRFAREAEHIVIDTQARPDPDDLETLAGSCHLLVLPSTPEALALDALLATVDALRAIQAAPFRVLLTIVPPRPSRDAEEARAALTEAGLPLFAAEIPRLAAFGKAALVGKPVSAVDDPRAARAWAAYEAAGKEILP